MTDEPSQDDAPTDVARDSGEDAQAPRLGRPTGTALEPPHPSVVANLPAAVGGRSYVDLRSPSFAFLAYVSILSLVADILSKNWAARTLEGYPNAIPVWKNHIAFVLAKNKGGAWGLLQGANESVRRPFFLLVSVAAIAFIVTLYRKLQSNQLALKWGLPLVLGGALGNVYDRIRFGSVIDFIDFHMMWSGRDHHWPTFNVADIAICVGVGLMAIDMFTSKRMNEVTASPLPTVPTAPAPPPPPPVSSPELASPAAETKT